MKSSIGKRVSRLMKQIKVYSTMRDSCYRMGCVSLGENCQRHIDKWDAQIVKMLKPLFKGETVEKYDHIGSITEMDIEAARCSDISALFPDHKAYMVICPFHSEKKASASIKKGFLVCFSCGEKADTIKCYMKLHNVGFVDAVKALR